MGLENIKAFKKALVENEELVKAIQEREKAYTRDKNDRDAVYKDIVVPFAKEHGFDFTVEELKSCEKISTDSAIGDKDFEAVSGGLSLEEDAAFGGCTSLESVHFPDSLVSIGSDIFDDSF